MTAARAAGLERVALLEEPQAAVYAWLDAQGDAWREQLAVGDMVLVCDIGGGTTDFSLIAIGERDGSLSLERVAVGDHILLGGDNMDWALAFHVKARIEAERKSKLDAWQLTALLQSVRAAKEDLLGRAERSEHSRGSPRGRERPGEGRVEEGRVHANRDVLGERPADRAIGVRELVTNLDDRGRIGLEPAQVTRNEETEEPGRVDRLDHGRRHRGEFLDGGGLRLDQVPESACGGECLVEPGPIVVGADAHGDRTYRFAGDWTKRRMTGRPPVVTGAAFVSRNLPAHAIRRIARPQIARVVKRRAVLGRTGAHRRQAHVTFRTRVAVVAGASVVDRHGLTNTRSRIARARSARTVEGRTIQRCPRARTAQAGITVCAKVGVVTTAALV